MFPVRFILKKVNIGPSQEGDSGSFRTKEEYPGTLVGVPTL